MRVDGVGLIYNELYVLLHCSLSYLNEYAQQQEQTT